VLIGVIVGLSMVLLLVVFRSVFIAVKAAVMNLLSICAAYGVLVAVTQRGWLGPAFGFPEQLPVTTWVPVFLFVILFGLSMDYEVFLLSKIREEYHLTGDSQLAVARGLAATARVISAAAAVPGRCLAARSSCRHLASLRSQIRPAHIKPVARLNVALQSFGHCERNISIASAHILHQSCTRASYGAR
jgi:hypothetical protein